MTVPALQALSSFKAGLESTYGTLAASLTHRIPFYRATYRDLSARIRPALLNGSLIMPNTTTGVKACEVELELPILYTGQLMLWDWLMGTGTYGSAGGAVTGAGPYTSTWTSIQQYLNSLSMEFSQGNIPNNKRIQLLGMKPVSWTAKWSGTQSGEDQLGRLIIKAIGYELLENQNALSNPGAPTLEFVARKDLTILTDIAQGATVPASLSWALTVDHKTIFGEFLEGGGHISEPQRSTYPSVKLDIERVLHVRTAQSTFQANTGGAWQIHFEPGATRIFDFAGAGIQTVWPDTPLDGTGDWIKQKISFENYDTGASETLALTITNSSNGILAN